MLKSILNLVRSLFGRRRSGLSQPRAPEKIVISDIYDKPLYFNVYSCAERCRIAEYGKERETWERFLHMLEPSDVVFDLGASVGLYTVAAASLLNKGTVCAFEPDPSTCIRLRENVSLNQLSNVKIVTWAVSDDEGEVTLYTNGASGSRSPSLVLDGSGSPRKEVKVPACSIDIALSRNELPLPDTLKVDIEGAEALFLKGGIRLLKGEFGKRPRMLLLELHPGLLPRFKSSPEEIREFLSQNDYELLWSQVRLAQEHLLYASGSSSK